MNTLNNALWFAAGATIASFVTWKLIKTKYEQLAQEEIEFVKERFEKKYSDVKEHTSDAVMVQGSNEKPSISEYASMINELKYSGEKVSKGDKIYDEVDKGGEYMSDGPYVISPDEFDDHEDYEVETLTYYADGVLTDWYDEPIDDVEDYVGKDALTRFGEYEKDTVYVRNDNHKCDYEIQRDTRNYTDVYPHRKED